MKKLSCFFILFVFSVAVVAQQPWIKSSSLDYSWQNVGNAGFSAGTAWYTSLAISPSGEPYVAYQDGGNANKASVMKFDGTKWVYVGNEGFSTGAIYTPILVFSTSGQPYIAFQDSSYGN